MTITKTQIIDNLIKYGIISKTQKKSYMKAKRSNLIGLMNSSLSKDIIKTIYEAEFLGIEDYKPIIEPIQPIKIIQKDESKKNNNYLKIQKILDRIQEVY